MEKIKLVDIIKRNIKKVGSGSELLYFYEIDKYLEKHGKRLTLEGIEIPKVFYNTPIFQYVYQNGLDLGIEEDIPKGSYGDIMKFMFKGTVGSIALDEQNDEVIRYSHDADHVQNSVMKGDTSSTAYLSLVASVQVKCYMEGKEMPIIYFNKEYYGYTELEYVHLYILREYSNKILKNKVVMNGRAKSEVQLEWKAYITFYNQRGLMEQTYTVNEKKNHLKTRFKEGDVVYIYTKGGVGKSRKLGYLESCYPAIIESITEEGVSLRYYPMIETRATRLQNLMELEERAEFSMDNITEKDYLEFIDRVEYYDYTSIGICGYSYDELNLLTQPLDFGTTDQWFKTEEGYKKHTLSAMDTVYAVFEDRGVKYNKDRFLKKYFTDRGRLPKYDKIMRGA